LTATSIEATLSLQYSKQFYYLREERNMYRGDAVRVIAMGNKSRLNTALQPDKELFNAFINPPRVEMNVAVAER
jgi:hypothetical protein